MKRFAFSMAAAVLILSTSAAASAQSLSFETGSLPITTHQAQVTGSGDLREEMPAPGLTFQGMPASSLQLAVLAPRTKLTQAQAAEEIKVVRHN